MAPVPQVGGGRTQCTPLDLPAPVASWGGRSPAVQRSLPCPDTSTAGGAGNPLPCPGLAAARGLGRPTMGLEFHCCSRKVLPDHCEEPSTLLQLLPMAAGCGHRRGPQPQPQPQPRTVGARGSLNSATGQCPQ